MYYICVIRKKNYVFVFRGYIKIQLPQILIGECLAFFPTVLYLILTSIIMRGYLW